MLHLLILLAATVMHRRIRMNNLEAFFKSCNWDISLGTSQK